MNWLMESSLEGYMIYPAWDTKLDLGWDYQNYDQVTRFADKLILQFNHEIQFQFHGKPDQLLKIPLKIYTNLWGFLLKAHTNVEISLSESCW